MCIRHTLTIIIAKNESIEPVETEEVEEVPGEGGHPADIHVGRLDPTLEHRLEAECEGERKFDYDSHNGSFK